MSSFVNVLKVLTAHVGGTVTGSIYYHRNLSLEMNEFIVVISELWESLSQKKLNQLVCLKISLGIDEIVLMEILFTLKK